MKHPKQYDSNYYKSLTRKLILTILLVSLTPMLIIYFVILNQFETSYTEKVNAHLKELVLKNKQEIDSFLQERLSNIKFLASTFGYEKLTDELFLQHQLSELQQKYNSVFVDIGLVDDKGIQVAYAGPFKLERAHYENSNWFIKSIKQENFISDVFLGLRGLPHFIVTSRQYSNGKYWILRATIDFVKFNLLVENLRIGKTGFAYILNRKGEFQTKSLIYVTPDKKSNDIFTDHETNNSSQVFFENKNDNQGNQIIYAATFLKNGDWLLIYRQDEDDAFADLIYTRNAAMIIFLICGIGIVSMAFVLSRRMVNKISKADQEKKLMNRQVIETGKLASIGELAAGIAHEINNPIAIMVEEAGWIQDLLEEEEFKTSTNLTEFERALKQIKTQGKRCKEITHKLLSFARKTDARIQEIQLNDLIKETAELSLQRAKYSNVVIDTDLQENLPELRLSQSEMQQVLLNLINNAFDAMEKSGGIIKIRSSLEDNFIVISVEDNGPGIPDSILSRIFDPFFTTKSVGKGTGLGLSICYGIINKLGGEIDVHSTVDYGTTFQIKLPLTSREVQK